eukprot:1159501-Pelagomonas_calceolata.AAC.5
MELQDLETHEATQQQTTKVSIHEEMRKPGPSVKGFNRQLQSSRAPGPSQSQSSDKHLLLPAHPPHSQTAQASRRGALLLLRIKEGVTEPDSKGEQVRCIVLYRVKEGFPKPSGGGNQARCVVSMKGWGRFYIANWQGQAGTARCFYEGLREVYKVKRQGEAGAVCRSCQQHSTLHLTSARPQECVHLA